VGFLLVVVTLAFGSCGGDDAVATFDDQGSLVLWVRPVGWDGAGSTDNQLVLARNPLDDVSGLLVFKNGAFLRFLFRSGTGVELNVGAVINTWRRGEWHHVAVAWGGTEAAVYIDCALIERVPYGGVLNVPTGLSLDVVADFPDAGALITQLAVLDDALAPAEVLTRCSTPPAGDDG
jgi:hypothetical protein